MKTFPLGKKKNSFVVLIAAHKAYEAATRCARGSRLSLQSDPARPEPIRTPSESWAFPNDQCHRLLTQGHPAFGPGGVFEVIYSPKPQEG